MAAKALMLLLLTSYKIIVCEVHPYNFSIHMYTIKKGKCMHDHTHFSLRKERETLHFLL